MKGRGFLAAAWLQTWMATSLRLPAPDGPYPVGTREFTLPGGGGRWIGLKTWYPAGSIDPALFEPYLQDAEMAQLHAGTGPNHFAYLARIKTHAQAGAPFAALRHDCPVVFFSHGHSLSNRTNSLVCESLASHGYVVAAIGHTGEGFCTLIHGEKIGIDPAIMENMLAEMRAIQQRHPQLNIRDHPAEFIRLLVVEGSYSAQRIALWTEDLHAAAGWFDAQVEPFFAGRVRSGRYAAFGHSFGGAAALRVLLYDPRFVCGVNMDGGQYGADFIDQTLERPMMVMSRNSAGLRSGFHPAQRGVWWLDIPAATHLNFSDGSLVYGGIPRLLGMNGRINGRKMISLMATILRAFFDRYLRRQACDLRGAIGQFPEVHPSYEETEAVA